MSPFIVLAVMCVGQITVSDPGPSVKYPVEVYSMTDDQFFQWATKFNVKQRADLEERRVTEPQYITGTETSTTGRWSGRTGGRRAAIFNVTGNQRTVTYQQRWLNPQYSGPGPLTIVNPYCKPSKPENLPCLECNLTTIGTTIGTMIGKMIGKMTMIGSGKTN